MATLARRDDPRARRRPVRARRPDEDDDVAPDDGFPWSRVIILALLVLLVGVGFFVGYLVLGSEHQEVSDDGAAVAAADAAAASAATTTPASPAATASDPTAAAVDGSGSASASSPPASVTAAAPNPAVTGAPPAATTADAGPAAAAPAVKAERIGDWFLVCPADGADKAKCVVQQQLRAPDGKQVVMVWTMHTDDKGVVHVLWQMPAGLDVPHGMILDIGDGKPKTVPFSGCDAKSCAVEVQLVPEYLGKIEAAKAISATVQPAATNVRPVRLGLSAKGLGDALARLVPPPAS